MPSTKTFQLWQSVNQTNSLVTGEDVYTELVQVDILGTCLTLADLKSFAAHPETIPSSWWGKRIYGWGTIQEEGGEEYVPYLNCVNPDIFNDPAYLKNRIIFFCLCLPWDAKDYVAYEVWDES